VVRRRHDKRSSDDHGKQKGDSKRISVNTWVVHKVGRKMTGPLQDHKVGEKVTEVSGDHVK
jgi:hypothetical protein